MPKICGTCARLFFPNAKCPIHNAPSSQNQSKRSVPARDLKQGEETSKETEAALTSHTKQLPHPPRRTHRSADLRPLQITNVLTQFEMFREQFRYITALLTPQRAAFEGSCQVGGS